MDVNDFMEETVALQKMQVDLLTEIRDMLKEQGAPVGVRVTVTEPSSTVQTAVETPAEQAGPATQRVEEKAAEAPVEQKPAEQKAEAPKEKKLTLVDVREAIFALGKREGQPAAIELLKSFGANKVSELKEEQFAEVIAKAQAA